MTETIIPRIPIGETLIMLSGARVRGFPIRTLVEEFRSLAILLQSREESIIYTDFTIVDLGFIKLMERCLDGLQRTLKKNEWDRDEIPVVRSIEALLLKLLDDNVCGKEMRGILHRFQIGLERIAPNM